MKDYLRVGYFVKLENGVKLIVTPFGGFMTVRGNERETKEEEIVMVAKDYDFKNVVWEKYSTLQAIEKIVLKHLLGCNVFNAEVDCVTFTKSGNQRFVDICFTNGDCATSMKYQDLFKNMDTNKKYKLKELSL